MEILVFLGPLLVFVFAFSVAIAEGNKRRRNRSMNGTLLQDRLDEILDELKLLREQQADLTLMVDDLAVDRQRLPKSPYKPKE